MRMNLTKVYYQLKPLLPRSTQIWLRRRIAQQKRLDVTGLWPILESAGKAPSGWPGWPDGKQFAFVLTHDVETDVGHERSWPLARLERELNVRSSYNFVPERYTVSPELRAHLVEHDFEVGVHGLIHDGRLYKSRQIFDERAKKINAYLAEWDAVGFRSPAMHHNLDWISQLNIDYDASTFDVDPFEPQPDGVETIFPFWVDKKTEDFNGCSGYVELPYTLPQDHNLFIILQEPTIAVWQEKLDWVVERNGMALLNTHPDYMGFGDSLKSIDEYPVGHYIEFINYVKERYGERVWFALPKEIAAYYRTVYRTKADSVSQSV
ncbi:hypothetical protein KFU94_61020 [Chloroflexi bacterium TSY]|nr:hypothetical protein [Chloroflexi bacterium TSY]